MTAHLRFIVVAIVLLTATVVISLLVVILVILVVLSITPLLRVAIAIIVVVLAAASPATTRIARHCALFLYLDDYPAIVISNYVETLAGFEAVIHPPDKALIECAWKNK